MKFPSLPPPWVELVRKVGQLEAKSRIQLGAPLPQGELGRRLGLTGPQVSQCLKVFPWLADPAVAGAASLTAAHALVLAKERAAIETELQGLLGLEVPLSPPQSAAEARARRVAQEVASYYAAHFDCNEESLTRVILGVLLGEA